MPALTCPRSIPYALWLIKPSAFESLRLKAYHNIAIGLVNAPCKRNARSGNKDLQTNNTYCDLELGIVQRGLKIVPLKNYSVIPN